MSASTGTPPGAKTLETLVDELDLPERDKELLRSRWLDQLRWMSTKARQSRHRHQRLRWGIAVGSVILPALVSFGLGAAENEAIRWAAFVVSLAVAILAATEEVFHFGDAWHHYRRTSELLKSSGWQFVQLTGPYARFATHQSALPAFTRRVEQILSEDVDEYFGKVMADDPGGGAGVVS